VIRRNVFVGNPPIQIDATFGHIGFDIQNLSPAGANLFEQNLCRTYFGAGSDPCSKLPRFAGHKKLPRFAGHKDTSEGSGPKP
jgi:hypothetical protein